MPIQALIALSGGRLVYFEIELAPVGLQVEGDDSVVDAPAARPKATFKYVQGSGWARVRVGVRSQLNCGTIIAVCSCVRVHVLLCLALFYCTAIYIRVRAQTYI